ncbi:MAG: hypothetical protein OXQ84_17645 [bacterium]|nr:hypothetical protein [bacterium]
MSIVESTRSDMNRAVAPAITRLAMDVIVVLVSQSPKTPFAARE